MQKMTQEEMKSFAFLHANGVKSSKVTGEHMKLLATFFAAHQLDDGAKTLGFKTGDQPMPYNDRLGFALRHAKTAAEVRTGCKNEDTGRFFWSLGYRAAAEALDFSVPTLAEQIPTVTKSGRKSDAAVIAATLSSMSTVRC
jgi:hypothetical protein